MIFCHNFNAGVDMSNIVPCGASHKYHIRSNTLPNGFKLRVIGAMLVHCYFCLSELVFDSGGMNGAIHLR